MKLGDGSTTTGAALNTQANKAGSLLILPYLFAPELSFCYYNLTRKSGEVIHGPKG